MARNQKNFKYFQYIDDDAAEWSVKGESGGAFSAVDGNAAVDLANPVWTGINKRHHPRYAVAQDPTTFRTVKGIVYTPTAYAAIARGDTIAVQVEGLATTVNYTVVAKLPERKRGAVVSRNLADT